MSSTAPTFNSDPPPWWHLLAILAVTFAMGAAMFANPKGMRSTDDFRNADWLSVLQFRAYLFKSVHEFGQFPFWNPYLGGGYPTVQHHSDSSLTPFAIPVLLLGEIYGVKINLMILLFLGGAGVFLIAFRLLKLPKTGALFSAMTYMVSGWFGSMMLVGFYNLAYFHLAPLLFYCLVRAFDEFRWVAPAAVLYALLSFVGGSGFYTVGVFSGLLALGYCVRLSEKPVKISLRPLIAVLVLLVLTLGVGAIKFRGVADLLNRGYYAHGEANDERRYEDGFPKDWFYRDGAGFVEALTWHVPKSARYENGRPTTLEYAYMGLPWGALALFLIYLVLAWRRFLPWLFAGLAMLVLCFGPNFPVDLYRLFIWPVEPLKNISQFYKYGNYFVFLVIAIGAGGAFAFIKKKTPGTSVFIAVVFLSLAPFAITSGDLLTETFKLDPPAYEPAQAFHQVKAAYNPPSSKVPTSHREMVRPRRLVGYYNIKQNVGTIDWYADVYLPENAVARYLIDPKTGDSSDNPEYRGEAHFIDDNGKVLGVDIKSNTIELKVDVEKPGVLVVNQNYHEGWRCPRGNVTPCNGLLSVMLGETGQYQVRMKFHPALLYRGGALSLATLMLCAAIWIVGGRRKRKPKIRKDG